jgi:uncharacterized protein (TIGR02246 family)
MLMSGAMGVMLLLAPGVGAGAQERAADERAVRDAVRTYADAREARDARAVEAIMTAEVDQLVSSGEWRRGRDKVVAGSMASTAESGGRRETVVERVRFVSDTVALADARYSITGLPAGDRRMWSTFVVTKESAGWRIAAIRNMLPSAATAPASAPK